MSERDIMELLSEANPVRLEELPQAASVDLDAILARRRPARGRPLLAAALVAAALAASLVGIFAFGGSHRHLEGHPQANKPSTPLFGPGVADLHVGSVEAADALLPFKVVLPSAEPLVIEVSPPNPPAYVKQRAHQATVFFDTPATGPYEVVEQPADRLAGIWKVSQLRRWAATCRNRIVCPIHRIVDVHGTHVLLIGAPGRPGGLKVFWLRGDTARSVLTWVQGPTDYAHGDLPRHRFKPRAALAVSASIIGQGG